MTTPCRIFRCKNKGCPMFLRIPLEMLLQRATDPEDVPNVPREVVLICHWCAGLGLYSLDPNSPDCCGEDKQVQLGRCDTVDRLLPLGLKCDEWESCNSRPPLLVTFGASAAKSVSDSHDRHEDTVYNALTRELSQEWAGLPCRNGHRIRFPQP